MRFSRRVRDFSDPTQVPDSLLDGGPTARTGIVGTLTDSETTIAKVITALQSVVGNDASDLNTLQLIYNTLNLARDRNFIFNRIADQVKLDVHTRIMAGQV